VERLNGLATTGDLGETNRKLRNLLIRLREAQTDAVPAILTELMDELVRASDLLRAPAEHGPDAYLEQQINQYCDNIKQLQEMLPAIQGRLIAERARLENIRSHLAAAANWAQTSRKTL